MELPSASSDDRLYDVDALTPDDVWAVGESVSDSGGRERTLIEHWDGAAWSIVSSPTVDPASALRGVTVIAADDAWAVGTYWNGHLWQGLVEHWDGASWTVVDAAPAKDDVEFSSVSAVGSNDVWAVGNACDKAAGAVIEHWNGRRWTVVDSPAIEHLPCLSDVDVIRADDIWVVGAQLGGATTRTVIEHWDGSAWSIVPSGAGDLQSVSDAGSNDVWAAGLTVTRSQTSRTLIEHWNGDRWQVADLPRQPGLDDSLMGVSARSDSEAMAVGETYVLRRRQSASIILHWDGSSWQHCGSSCPR